MKAYNEEPNMNDRWPQQEREEDSKLKAEWDDRAEDPPH